MISFNILFWDNGDSERIENVNYVFNSFKNQINDKYILNLFDFSEKIVIKNSIHIPYPKDYFLKSKKINDVLKFNKQLNCDFICLIDSDIFLLDEDFDVLIENLKKLRKDEFYVSDCYDLYNKEYVLNGLFNEKKDFISKRSDTTLGGFFIVPYNVINEIGGFDERFIVWGGEDDDMNNRLVKYGLIRKKLTLNTYHLPHRKLDISKTINGDEYKNQVNILCNDKTIIRNI